MSEQEQADQQAAREALARMPIVLEIPEMREVVVRRDLPFAGTGAERALDLYTPPAATAPLPAVIFVFGFPQPLFAQHLKEMGGYRSWARLLAASGLAAVTYRYVDPVTDLAALLGFLRERGPELGIDPSRLAFWSGSGNVPVALGALLDVAQAGRGLRAAALCYGYLFEGEVGEVSAAQAAFGFAAPALGRTVADLPADLPLLVARAGRDETPGLNAALDAFVAAALARNLPLTLLNHPTGPHAFDIFDDSAASRTVIRAIVAFLRECRRLTETASIRRGSPPH
ncbi:MAG: hypothetical protein RBU45_14490 [Myxococcota bacterium]|jgi:acetyl esterase/lipase|nr:hypothetical protein [Myxococcota bacterium]